MTAPKDPQKTGKKKQKSAPAGTSQGNPEGLPAGAEAPQIAAKPAEDFPIVGVGASAGGLKALEGFFAGVPENCGMAFVVVQHLDPRRESLLKSLLGQYTAMPVLQAEEGTRIEAGHVYVKAPGQDVVIRDGILHLEEPAEPPTLRHPIDAFLRALADDQGERAIGVILSGTGTDGTLGVRAVHAAGGLAVVQEEQQAEYDGMPRSAIDTGMVDFVLPVEKMGAELVRYCAHPLVARREMKRGLAEERFGQELANVLGILRAQTGHDFTLYKRNTIRRRIERRLAIHKIERLADYAALLRQNPAEGQALFKDLLINVTSFFRDREAFELLGEELVQLLQERPAEEPVRVWIPGCATGEEAYTVAILLLEAMERLERTFSVKIFASDINPQAIETGREGTYPDSIAVDVSERRLKRYFTRHDGHYRVDGRLREMVVFAVHDVTRDPPFSRIDFVCCRNLLIYLDARLQKKVIPLLHYSLRPGGILLLGSSEEVGEFGDLFAPVHRKWKLFRALETSAAFRHQEFNMMPVARPEMGVPTTPQPAEKPVRPLLRGREAALRGLVEASLMEEFTPPGVLLDERDEVVFFHGETSPYLTPPRGEPTLQIARLARGEMAEALPELLTRTRALQQRVYSEGLRLPTVGGSLRVEVAVKPLPAAGPGHLLVTFKTQDGAGPEAAEAEPDLRLAELQRELFSTRQDLQATIEELETVNAELKKKNDELVQANDDINNLFTATDIGTVILDTRMRIKRFTPAATRFFRLIASDLGRPITDIVTTLVHEGLDADLREVLDTLHRKEREVHSRDGRWYSVHILPYRTSANVIAGLILTFTDITPVKEAQLAAHEERHYAESILETLREPLLVLDAELAVVSANRAFYRTFRVSSTGTEKTKVFALGDRQWDIPDLRELLERIIPDNEVMDDFRVEHEFPAIGRRTFLLNARRIDREAGKPKLILLAFEDVTAHEESGHGNDERR